MASNIKVNLMCLIWFIYITFVIIEKASYLKKKLPKLWWFQEAKKLAFRIELLPTKQAMRGPKACLNDRKSCIMSVSLFFFQHEH